MAVHRKWVALVILGIFVVAAGIFGYGRWKHAQWHIETEDAYVRGHIFSVSSRIAGTLLSLEVQENEAVRAGQTIATVDPKDYDAAVVKAEASTSEAAADCAVKEAAIAQAKAQVLAARSQLQLAASDLARIAALNERQSIPRQKYDQAVTAEAVARAQLAAAEKTVSLASAGLEVSRKKTETAEAQLEQARLQRSYCTIVAPADGVVSRKMAEAGNVVAPGQPLCAVVPLALNDIWVEANFKETQLKNVRPGQPCTLRADIDKGKVYTGKVDSISAGTGAAFSLLPPENATGNWVKVVQRVPVKILIDPSSDPEHRLRVGLSVKAAINTKGR
jgi:membrane fusion protein (multidrug efflux system)